ncbi:zinc ribbon domain-containing protein [Oligoflexia bacterium]|nr:zinc ribbon domain-containing protein [Oligoflexia bacterium]
MFCRKCGHELQDDSKFCNKCGVPVEPLKEQVTTPQVAAEAPTQSKKPPLEFGTEWDWVLSVFSLIIALAGMLKSPFTSIVWIAVALLISPVGKQQLRKFHQLKYGWIFNIIVFVVGAYTSVNLLERAKQIDIQIEQQARAKILEMDKKEDERRLAVAKEKVPALLEKGDYKTAWRLAREFKEDKELIVLADRARKKYSVTEEKRLLAVAKKIPSKEYKKNLVVYEELNKLLPENKAYKAKYDKYLKLWHKGEGTRRAMANSDLELIKWSWSNSSSYVTAKGQVKNISGRKLKSVVALVSFFDKNDNFITSDTSLIEYNPIMPGQISPFSVIERYNPAMKTARVEFKHHFGGKIPTYQKK